VEIAIFGAVLMLAYVNGANDNFKGVSTLFGGGILNYKEALTWSSFSTAVGCLAAMLLVHGLAKKFSGAGLIDPILLANPILPLSVAIAALGTVALATQLGFPISTTHALVGSLAGVGFSIGFADGFKSQLATLFLPLLLSPLIAASIACVGWFLFKKAKGEAFVGQPIEDSCLCIDPRVVPSTNSAFASAAISIPSLTYASRSSCQQRNLGEIFRLPRRDLIHLGSAFAVCAARGLNDAPKIAGLLLLSSQGGLSVTSYVAISIAMVLGGVFHSHKIAERMSVKVSQMNEKSSVWNNLVTSSLVVFASKMGVPVSTTHTSVGSIAGTGKSEGKLQLNELGKIFGAWILTLPCAFLIALLISKSLPYIGATEVLVR